MKRYFSLFALLCVLALPALSYAQTMKIGLVNVQKALNDVEEGKRAKAQLRSQFDQKQNALNAKRDSLKTLADQFAAQRGTLSEQAAKQKEAELRDKSLELQKLSAQFTNELATKEAELTQSIITKLRGVVQSIGQKNGYQIIFETSQDAVLYAPDATDLTAQVIQAYNSGAK